MANQSVLLVFCSSGDKGASINNLPPLGILGIASYLEQRGIPTDVIDFSVTPEAVIQPEKYTVVGFSVNISNHRNTLHKIAEIKRQFPNQHIIVGGPLCMCNPEVFFQSEQIDAIFTCEGEEALYAYLTEEHREEVKGIYLKKDSEYTFTGKREWIKDLDSLPFPAYEKVPLRKYNGVPKRRWPVCSIMTSRGCPFSCIFCSHAMGRKWRARSPERVVEEIQWLVDRFGVKEICIYDDNFSLNKERAAAICDLLIENKVPISLQFANGLRVDTLDETILAKLKSAGTWLIGIAPEVGNPDVMRKIKKGFDHAQVIAIRNTCKRLGIKTFGFYMIGFPFENRKEIEETIEFAIHLDCEIVEFNKVVPYANTELFDLIVEGGHQFELSPSEVQSYHQGSITTHRVGDLAPDEVKMLIQQAYRKYYLRPRKMVDLLTTFSIGDLWLLSTYALRTRNI